ncbi:MAG: hypothetical protein PHT94_00960 [Candidatus Nanoarchaeia archaeon]|nr:hypothetical protein [Candidatus Nanoarchaeia archaeon]
MNVVTAGEKGKAGVLVGEFENLKYSKMKAGMARKSYGSGGWSEIKTPDGEVIRVDNP